MKGTLVYYSTSAISCTEIWITTQLFSLSLSYRKQFNKLLYLKLSNNSKNYCNSILPCPFTSLWYYINKLYYLPVCTPLQSHTDTHLYSNLFFSCLLLFTCTVHLYCSVNHSVRKLFWKTCFLFSIQVTAAKGVKEVRFISTINNT